jgi:hypothetical protein
MNNNSTGKFNAEPWTALISGIGQGANTAFQSAAGYANSKEEAKEAKRRTLADLLNKAMRRKHALTRAGVEYGDEAADYKAQSLQQAAQGFINALK